MTKKYRLLKDTPRTRAGEIFQDQYYIGRIIFECESTQETFAHEVIVDNRDWFEPIPDEPEFKIMSPAILFLKNGESVIPQNLFENESNARDFCREYFNAIELQWPAMQQVGTELIPIQYRVPMLRTEYKKG